MTRLEAGPCVVRDWRPGDEPALVRAADNRKIWLNLAHHFPHPYTDADADFWLALVAAASEPTHWAIEVDGEVAGGIGVEIGEGIHARTGRFGYWLAEAHWGRGIATAAARATVEHVFARFDVVRLEASVFEWNPASMRVLEKCGFAREGVLRCGAFKDGRVIDTVLYARIR